MIRHRYAIFLFALPGAWAQAQPTLTAANDVPIAGQEFATRYADNHLEAGPAGANQSFGYWTMLVPAAGQRNYRWFNANITPSSALVPTATLISTDGGTDTLYWAVTGQGLEQVGARTVLYQGTISYSDPYVELKLPCTFGTTWTDAHAASYSVGGFPVTRTGTVTGHADAYGTLRMPQGAVFNDVLRVRVRRNLTDAALIATTQRIETVHYFYVPGARYPTLKLMTDSLSVNGGAWGVSKRAEWMGADFTVGIEGFDEDALFTAYPNPADGFVAINLPGTGAAIEVLDAAGRVLERHRAQGERHVLGTAHLPAGLYVLRAIMADGHAVARQLVVNR